MSVETPGIPVDVVYALPDEQQCVSITLPQGCTTARQALIHVLETQLVRLANSEASTAPEDLPIGVYGQSVADDYVLEPDDRLEIYRPLEQDPKDRRRRIAREARNGKAGN